MQEPLDPTSPRRVSGTSMGAICDVKRSSTQIAPIDVPDTLVSSTRVYHIHV
jgi:hypothetical protein